MTPYWTANMIFHWRTSAWFERQINYFSLLFSTDWQSVSGSMVNPRKWALNMQWNRCFNTVRFQFKFITRYFTRIIHLLSCLTASQPKLTRTKTLSNVTFLSLRFNENYFNRNILIFPASGGVLDAQARNKLHSSFMEPTSKTTKHRKLIGKGIKNMVGVLVFEKQVFRNFFLVYYYYFELNLIELKNGYFHYYTYNNYRSFNWYGKTNV